jgi:hypothetical protein
MELNNEQQLRLKRIEAAGLVYENLLANPDFLVWKEEAVQVRLDYLKELVVTVDRSQPNWKEVLADRLVAYQEFRHEFEYMFALKAESSVRARKATKALQEGS